MATVDYVVNLETHAELVIKIVSDLVKESNATCGFSPLRHQLQIGDVMGDYHFVESNLDSAGFKVTADSPFDEFSNDTSDLGAAKLIPIRGLVRADLQRRVQHFRALDVPERRLVLKFEQVDTEELKDVEIRFDGDRAIFKVGEGEMSHYHVPNDKKLWETQFMICQIDGQYYIRDVGFVHASRLKLDTRVEVQLQKGALVDLGKVVHYHFDKAIHLSKPD